MSLSLADAASVARRGTGIGPRRLLSIAARELRSGLGGFYIFVACVALGVMVITAVGALSDALRAGFERQGRVILGGDVSASRMHTRATAAERAWLDGEGGVSETATMRTMVRLEDGSDQSLVELKAVDAAYPLAGAVKLRRGSSLAAAIDGDGAAVEPLLMERLRVKIGGTLMLGTARVTVRAALEHEPDQIVDRLTYGPRIVVSHETLEKSGLARPGSLVRWRYAVALPAEDRGLGELALFRDELKQALPQAGFSVLDRRDPSPQVSRTISRVREFLTLVGLTALLVGGVGVASAVATFVDRRRKVIATMKSLGATSGAIFAIFLAQILAIAAIGIAIGLVAGYGVVLLLDVLYGTALPIRAEFSIQPLSIGLAAAYGLLVALAFALWPLGRAELVSAAVLFRDEVAPERTIPRARVLGAIAAVVVTLVALAVLGSEAKLLALYYCLGVIAVLGAFFGLGLGVTRVARITLKPRRPELALALGRIGAPGGLTPSVVLSLGAGLSLLVVITLANASIEREFKQKVPERSPDYFLLDIGTAEFDGVAALVRREAPEAEIEQAPMLRGRLVALNGVPVETIKPPAEAQWVLSGDRGLTYAPDVPKASRVVAGSWWAADYAGEPLVSFEAKLAERLGLKIGDSVTVNVLGRDVTARIANLREVDWESLAINFVMVFSPNTLAGAPSNLLATVALPKDVSLAREAAIARELGRAHPTITVIRVKDAVAAIGALLSKLVTAVRAAGSVTLIAGALVLAGALATAQRRRLVETAILKALGATRRRVLVSHLLEYLAIAVVTASLAVLLGTAVAWMALTQVMEIDFAFSWSAVLQALGLALVLVALLGGIGTWRVLGAPTVPYLRAE